MLPAYRYLSCKWEGYLVQWKKQSGGVTDATDDLNATKPYEQEQHSRSEGGLPVKLYAMLFPTTYPPYSETMKSTSFSMNPKLAMDRLARQRMDLPARLGLANP